MKNGIQDGNRKKKDWSLKWSDNIVISDSYYRISESETEWNFMIAGSAAELNINFLSAEFYIF